MSLLMTVYGGGLRSISYTAQGRKDLKRTLVASAHWEKSNQYNWTANKQFKDTLKSKPLKG